MGHEIVGIRTVHEGWCKLMIAQVRGPDGHVMTREVEDHGQAVAVLPYDPERRVAMLLRQFRAPAFFAAGEPDLLECPAGLLDEESPDDCARREVMEEVGVRLGSLEPVVEAWALPGHSTERIHLYLAPYGADDRTGAGGGVAAEHEDIVLTEMSLGELARLADAGELKDMKTLLLVQTLRLRHPALF